MNEFKTNSDFYKYCSVLIASSFLLAVLMTSVIEYSSELKLILFFIVIGLEIALVAFIKPFKNSHHYCLRIPTQIMLIFMIVLTLALEIQKNLKERQKYKSYGVFIVIGLTIVVVSNILVSVTEMISKSCFGDQKNLLESKKTKMNLAAGRKIETKSLNGGGTLGGKEDIDMQEFWLEKMVEGEIGTTGIRTPMRGSERYLVNQNHSRLNLRHSGHTRPKRDGDQMAGVSSNQSSNTMALKGENQFVVTSKFKA